MSSRIITEGLRVNNACDRSIVPMLWWIWQMSLASWLAISFPQHSFLVDRTEINPASGLPRAQEKWAPFHLPGNERHSSMPITASVTMTEHAHTKYGSYFPCQWLVSGWWMRLKGKSARRGRASGEKDYPLIKYTHSYPHARTRVRTYTQVPGKYAVLSLDLFVWCDAWSSVCHLVTRSGKWKDGKPLSPWWHHCAPESGTIYLYLDGWQTLFSVSFFFFNCGS